MSDWGRAVYGDPCRECGFDWSISQEDAVAYIATIPARYAYVFRGRDGTQRLPGLGWSTGAYVCHVGDNLRIWADRLAGRALGSLGHVVPYDQNLLARARAYEQVPIQDALWALERSVGDWLQAVELALGKSVVLTHPERGRQSVLDVSRNNAHDAHHHQWDIRRSIE